MLYLLLTFLTVFIILVNARENHLSLSVFARHTRSRMRNLSALRTTSAPNAVEEYFSQTLDHANASAGQYKQRYWYNTQYWDGSGPVFLLIDGEGSGSSDDVLYGHHVDMAKVFKALLLSVEHRFYGKSIPNGDVSLENLQFLSSEQALSDLSTITKYFQSKFNLTESNTLISFGGSYPGALSSWFRLKYPELVYAAVSSSGPVDAETDFFGYNQVVAQSMATKLVGGSQICAQNIATAFVEIDRLIGTGQEGLASLDRKFNTCKPLNASDDITTFVSNLAGIFQGTVQYNLQESDTIETLCDVMHRDKQLDASGAMDALVNVSYRFYSGNCLDCSFSDSIGELNVTFIDTEESVGERQWYYQTCNEFGYYQTCEKRKGSCLFSERMDLESFTSLCQSLFGISVDNVNQRVIGSDKCYGSKQPDSTRVLFVNGVVDPWHYLSITSDKQFPADEDLNAILIAGGSHCENMGESTEDDSDYLKDARKQIQQKVGQWLEETSQRVM